ncbi:hypothetical protein [Paenibacillus dauci]|uniref:hypothetical protein n=1 Tax=Paenibacillus dauci TaxID=1567106 RepID=UPI000619375A|nr:hypothetical protein [Paenibacillus dauci]
MKKLTAAAKKKIQFDWQTILYTYKLYRPLHFIKRHGPILLGIYLKPVYGGEGYVPVFHTHSLMTSFPVVSLTAQVALTNSKDVEDSIRFVRHTNELDTIVSKFRVQCPAAFAQPLTCTIIEELYNSTIVNANDYPVQAMTDAVLLSLWCSKEEQAEAQIQSYRSIIARWPAAAQNRFGGSDKWEADIRLQWNREQIINTIQTELIRFKLGHLQDMLLDCE